MLALSSAADGRKTNAKIPVEYAMMKYRERFHLTWWEFLEVPTAVFLADMAMIDIEETVLQSRQKKPYASPRR